MSMISIYDIYYVLFKFWRRETRPKLMHEDDNRST